MASRSKILLKQETSDAIEQKFLFKEIEMKCEVMPQANVSAAPIATEITTKEVPPIRPDDAIEFYNFWCTAAQKVKKSILATQLGEIQKDFKAKGGWDTMPNIIFVTIHINSISELNVVTGEVVASGSIHFRWFQREFVDQPQGTEIHPSFSGVDGFTIWSPNAMEFQLNRNPIVHRKFKHHVNGECYTHVGWNATFRNAFDVRSFPFDAQAAHFTFVFSDGAFPGKPHYGYLFVPDYQFDPSIPVRTSHEWKFFISKPIFSEWQVFQPHFNFGVETGGSYKSPSKQEVDMEYILVRRPLYYNVTIIGTTFCSLSITFFAFALPADSASDRISLGVTMMLTVQAVKFVASQDMPKVAYLTFIDKYFMPCNFFFFLLILSFALLPKLLSDEPLAKWDSVVCWTILAFWCFVHLELVLEVAFRKSRARLGTEIAQLNAKSYQMEAGGHLWSTQWCFSKVNVHTDKTSN